MRFSVELPTQRVGAGDEFVSAAAIAAVARGAEEAGFSACFVTDHPFPGKVWLDAGGHHTLDPFVALSFAAAATSVLRVQTHILVLPYRNPFLIAKAAASLDVLSGGRLILGVAAGYLESEFAALGGDFGGRDEVADQSLAAMVRAWSGEPVTMDGVGFRARDNVMLPQPLQRPHPPLWIGGNSKRAIRRAVEHGDGWVPFPNPAPLARFSRTAVLVSPADLAERIAYAREYAVATGRERPLEVCYAIGTGRAATTQQIIEAVGVWARLGVGWLTVAVPGRTRAEYCDGLRRFGAEVIARC
jgi:probable F420-dependent oxidoreductase